MRARSVTTNGSCRRKPSTDTYPEFPNKVRKVRGPTPTDLKLTSHKKIRWPEPLGLLTGDAANDVLDPNVVDQFDLSIEEEPVKSAEKSSEKTLEKAQRKSQRLTEQFIRECRARLVEMKAEILNQVRASFREYEQRDRGGSDEGDMTMAILAENDFLSAQGRLKDRLQEIEWALARIERGSYGICEETDEPIEIERLRALPWTRLSIEGAEIREAMNRKFAR